MASRVSGSVKESVVLIDKRVRAAARNALLDTGEQTRRRFSNVVGSWEHKPRFALKPDPTDEKREIRYLIVVTGAPLNVNIWQWIDRGTGEHGVKGQGYFIFPVNAPALVFNLGYNAMTEPVALFNVGSGIATGALVVSLGVYHPGIRARLFSKTYGEEALIILVTNFKERIRKISKAS